MESSRTQNGWSTTYQNTSTEAFELNDGTAKVQIQLTGANVILHDASQKEKSYFGSMDPKIEAALKGMGQKKTIFSFVAALNHVRVRKGLIKPGERIYVTGNIKYKDK